MCILLPCSLLPRRTIPSIRPLALTLAPSQPRICTPSFPSLPTLITQAGLLIPTIMPTHRNIQPLQPFQSNSITSLSLATNTTHPIPTPHSTNKPRKQDKTRKEKRRHHVVHTTNAARTQAYRSHAVSASQSASQPPKTRHRVSSQRICVFRTTIITHTKRTAPSKPHENEYAHNFLSYLSLVMYDDPMVHAHAPLWKAPCKTKTPHNQESRKTPPMHACSAV
jgi:hypothetical protein